MQSFCEVKLCLLVNVCKPSAVRWGPPPITQSSGMPSRAAPLGRCDSDLLPSVGPPLPRLRSESQRAGVGAEHKDLGVVCHSSFFLAIKGADN